MVKDEMDKWMNEFLKAKYTKHLQSLDLNKKKGSSIFVINDEILELLVLLFAKNSLFPKDFEGYERENSKIVENLNEISKMIQEIHLKVDSLQ
ncbi:hypothetical protein [Bacillus salipaludis]|uniref:hypothetical protein n=1 Tax=Bacillus salipaludis TaxID=2547811 RepID=UPI002E2508E9|nr:hypothetical protein [Bacillus salipaludis]